MVEETLSSLPGYALRRAANAMTAELASRLAKHDVRIVDATVLLLIATKPGATASSIGRTLDIQRANMVPLLKRLEDAGMIGREPIDGKSQGLVLTEEGKARFPAIRRTLEAFEQDLLARVPAEHREHLLPALNALWK